MKSYNHFTPNERECLYLLLKNNYSITQIAKELGRDKSTISREIRRNSDGNGNYTPFDAHMLYLIRRNECKRKSRIKRSSRLYKYIKDKLRKFWSPEVISESWNKSNPDDRISFSTIYNAVKNGLFDGITVQTHLRRRGKKKYGKRSRFCTIHPEHTIHERPKKAEKRSECGHFEGDTVRGAVGKGCIVTFVDRKSRKLLSAVSKDMSSKSVYDAILRAFKGIHPKSITLDNGSEFALFKQLEKALEIKSLISSTLVLAFVSTSFLLIVFFVALDLTICQSPRPPFALFLSPGENTFGADNLMYHSFKQLDIELYTDRKSPEAEERLEDVLRQHNIYYTKTESWIESEKLYEVLYEMEV